jgi:hypothetical protein
VLPNRIQLVLFVTCNRTLIPYVAALHRLLSPVIAATERRFHLLNLWYTVVIFGIQIRTFLSFSAATHRSRIPAMLPGTPQCVHGSSLKPIGYGCPMWHLD